MSFSVDIPPTPHATFDMAVRKALEDSNITHIMDDRPLSSFADVDAARKYLDAAKWQVDLASRLADYVINLTGAWDSGTISATISGHASVSGEPDMLAINLSRVQ